MQELRLASSTMITLYEAVVQTDIEHSQTHRVADSLSTKRKLQRKPKPNAGADPGFWSGGPAGALSLNFAQNCLKTV